MHVAAGLVVAMTVAACTGDRASVPAFAADLPGQTVCVLYRKDGGPPDAERVRFLRETMSSLRFAEIAVPSSNGSGIAFLADAKIEVGWSSLATSTPFRDALALVEPNADEVLFVDLQLALDAALARGASDTGDRGGGAAMAEGYLRDLLRVVGVRELRALVLGIATTPNGTRARGALLGSGNGFGPLDLIRGPASPLPLPSDEPHASAQFAFRVQGDVAARWLVAASELGDATSLMAQLAGEGQRLLVRTIGAMLPDLSGWVSLRHLGDQEYGATLVPNDAAAARDVLERKWPPMLRDALRDRFGMRIVDDRVWLHVPPRGPFPRTTTFVPSSAPPLEGGLLYGRIRFPAGSAGLGTSELRVREHSADRLTIELDLP